MEWYEILVIILTIWAVGHTIVDIRDYRRADRIEKRLDKLSQ
jgi:hypothetical protein